MAYIGDFALGSTFDTKFTTRRFSTGAPFTLAGTPVISAYVDNSVTQLTAGITLSVDFDSVTGLNNIRVVATSGNGYASGSNYQLVITTGTVDSVSVVGEVVAEFSIEARSSLRPTTAGRTLDVSAGGEAGLDWANVSSPTTAQDLSGTTISTSQAVASVSGAVGSVTGAVGSVTGLTASNLDTTVSSRLAPTVAGRTLDVSATGEAGLDWANIGAPTTAQGLTGTTIATSQVVASVSGAVGSVTGAVGSVTGNVGGDVQGNVDGSIGSVGVGGIAATSYAAGAIDAASIAANAIGASELAADAVAEIADGVWDEARSGHTTQGTYGENQNAVISASAVTGTLSTTQMTTDLTNATDDSMNGRTVIFVGNVTAALAGQATNITDYVGATKLVTMTAVTTAPANGDLFLVV